METHKPGTSQLGRMGANIAGTLFRRFATLPLGLLTVLILARSLEPEGLGQYNLALFLPLLISTFSNFGIAPANLYFMGRDPTQLPHAYRATLILWGGLTGLGIIIALPIILFIPDILFPDVPTQYLWLSLVAYPLMLLRIFWLSLLQGTQNFREFNIISVVIPFISLILLFFAVIVFNFGVMGALSAYILGQLVGVIITWRKLREKVTDKPIKDIAIYIREVLGYGWKANASNIIAFLNYRIDLYLINLLLNPTAVGLYFAAVRLVELLWLPTTASTIVLGPRIAELYRDEATRQELTPLILRVTILLTLLMAIGMLIIGFPIFTVLGSAYRESYPIFLILMPGAIMMGISKVLGGDLASRRHLKLNFYTAVITLVLEVVLISLLAVQYGLTGVAIASSLAYSFQAVVSLHFYTRVTKLQWWRVFMPNKLDLELIRQAYKLIITNLNRVVER